MDSIEDPSNTLRTIVGEELTAETELLAEAENKLNEEAENKLNEEAGEVVGNKPNKIRRKRGRPSEKDRDKEDKEDLPESKKVKKSPRKKINLKKMSINSNGKKQALINCTKRKTKKNVYSVRRSTFGKLSVRVWVRRNPIYCRYQSAGVTMLVSRMTW